PTVLLAVPVGGEVRVDHGHQPARIHAVTDDGPRDVTAVGRSSTDLPPVQDDPNPGPDRRRRIDWSFVFGPLPTDVHGDLRVLDLRMIHCCSSSKSLFVMPSSSLSSIMTTIELSPSTTYFRSVPSRSR